MAKESYPLNMDTSISSKESEAFIDNYYKLIGDIQEDSKKAILNTLAFEPHNDYKLNLERTRVYILHSFMEDPCENKGELIYRINNFKKSWLKEPNSNLGVYLNSNYIEEYIQNTLKNFRLLVDDIE